VLIALTSDIKWKSDFRQWERDTQILITKRHSQQRTENAAKRKHKTSLEKLKPFLKKQYQVESTSVFSFFARGEQTPESDIDILVEFSNQTQSTSSTSSNSKNS